MSNSTAPAKVTGVKSELAQPRTANAESKKGLVARTKVDKKPASTEDLTEIMQSTERQLSVDEHIAIEESKLRHEMAKRIISFFFAANAIVIFLMLICMLVDQYNVAYELKSDRIVGESAIMSLIGATVVQLGAISLALSAWLFPKKQ